MNKISAVPDLTHENYKQFLSIELNRRYHDFCSYIQQLPIMENIKANAILNLDTGFLWLKEGIVFMQAPQESAALTEKENEALVSKIIEKL